MVPLLKYWQGRLSLNIKVRVLMKYASICASKTRVLSWLSDRPFSLTKLSYASHTYRFPSRLDIYPPERLETLLADAFLQLLDLTISTIRHDPEYPAGSPSYNVIITLDHLHLIPRRQENYILPESGDKLSVNALGYAGMLLVKSEEELEIVKRETVGKILRGVGLASVHELQVEGTAQEAPLAGL